MNRQDNSEKCDNEKGRNFLPAFIILGQHVYLRGSLHLQRKPGHLTEVYVRLGLIASGLGSLSRLTSTAILMTKIYFWVRVVIY